LLASEAESVGLSALAPPEIVLMSCADDVGGYSALSSALGGDANGETPEPLWCENPESPHCQPGTPDSHHPQHWLGAMRATDLELSAARSTWLLRIPTRWSRPHASQRVPAAPGQRLERPPRIA
jgi:hypothetical protein